MVCECIENERFNRSSFLDGTFSSKSSCLGATLGRHFRSSLKLGLECFVYQIEGIG